MNAGRDRVSRWTPAIFSTALGNLLLGLLLAFSGVAWPIADQAAPATLAMVHLLTIGWLTLLMFGALFQFVPVITSRNLPHQVLPLITLLGVQLGLLAMVAGFLVLGGASAADLLLPAGGALVMIAILIGSVTLLVPLLGKRPRPLSANFVLVGLGFLVLTISLGLAFACALTVPASRAALVPLFPMALPYHVMAGLGGWFTLTAIGVSYELLPMFMLAPHERGVLPRLVFVFGAGGFALAFIAGIAAIFLSVGWLSAAGDAGNIAILFSLACYLADLVVLYRARKRRIIELHNRAAVAAFASLGAALLLACAAWATGLFIAVAPFLVFLLLLGWLSGLGLTQLYKIIPFLAWLNHFGSHLGRGPVPRVQDLVNERGAMPMFALYFVAVAALPIAMALHRPEIGRALLAAILVAILLLAREYRRAWTSHYANQGHSPNHPIKAPASSFKGVQT